MCGRFTLTTPTYSQLIEVLGTEPEITHQVHYRPRFNVAPRNTHWVFTANELKKRLFPAVWGLIPKWSKEPKGFINARLETAEKKPSFQKAFWAGRCGIPADGFFEWTGENPNRKPFWFSLKNKEIFFFAGLCQDWQDPKTDESIPTFTILTAPAQAPVDSYHHRMPVMLSVDNIQEWIKPQSPFEAKTFLEKHLLLPNQIVAVSRHVNAPQHDDPRCIEALRSC